MAGLCQFVRCPCDHEILQLLIIQVLQDLNQKQTAETRIYTRPGNNADTRSLRSRKLLRDSHRMNFTIVGKLCEASGLHPRFGRSDATCHFENIVGNPMPEVMHIIGADNYVGESILLLLRLNGPP